MPINVHDAKTHFSKLLERVELGEEIIIARDGKPVAKLVPLRAGTIDSLIGLYDGQGWIAPDFDDPLPEDVLKDFEG